MSRALALAAIFALGGAVGGALGGCTGQSAGPRWPKSAATVAEEDWREDGGQSLAPRAGTPAVEAAADRRSELEPAAERTSPAEAPAATPVAPGAVVPTTSERELQEELDAIELQESIIIEIED